MMAADSETRKAATRTLATYENFVFTSIGDLQSRVREASPVLGEKTIGHLEPTGSVFVLTSYFGGVRCDGLDSVESLRS